MKKGILFATLGVIIICLMTINFFHISSWQNEKKELENKYNSLQSQYQVLYDHNQTNEQIIQETEVSLIMLNDWAEKDGYKNNVDEWWHAIQQCKNNYTTADKKFAETDAVNYATEEQKAEIKEIVSQINSSRNLIELRELIRNFNTLTENINKQKNLKISGEETVTSDAYEWNNSEQKFSNISQEGLTQESGINYYNGRTETYYSSNILYHYQTPEWELDSEGYYHNADGYYVVAASDMPQGTIFEGSKGTCIVLDSGCAEGITDYYVAW